MTVSQPKVRPRLVIIVDDPAVRTALEELTLSVSPDATGFGTGAGLFDAVEMHIFPSHTVT